MPQLESFDLRDLNEATGLIQSSRTRLLDEERSTIDTARTGSVRAKEKKPMKLIAEFAMQRPPVPQVSRTKSIFRNPMRCLTRKTNDNKNDDSSDVEVINLKVPVENLSKNLLIQVDCKETRINIELHPPINKDHFQKLNREIEDFQAAAKKDTEVKEKQRGGNRRDSSRVPVLKKVFSKLTRKSDSASSFKWFGAEKRGNPVYVSESLTCYSSGFLTRSTMFRAGSTVSLGSVWSREDDGCGDSALKLSNTL